MRANRKNYRRLGRSAWLGGDYLLVVNAHFFNEHFMRLYRGDIESMIFYSLPRNQGALLVCEWTCALAPLAFCAYGFWLWHELRKDYAPMIWQSLIPGTVFLAAYSAWRWAQPNWACLLSTRTSRAGLFLGRTLRDAKRKFADLVAWVARVQPPLSVIEGVEIRRVAALDPKAPKQYTQAIHASAFACGAIGWILIATGSPYLIGVALFVLPTYYILLGAAYLAQAAFEFPFAVKSAAVMSQISALLWLLMLITSGSASHLYFLIRGEPLAELAGISAVAFSLYGIVAMTLAATEMPTPGTARRSVLGLEG